MTDAWPYASNYNALPALPASAVQFKGLRSPVAIILHIIHNVWLPKLSLVTSSSHIMTYDFRAVINATLE